jgi:hypothetical protein
VDGRPSKRDGLHLETFAKWPHFDEEEIDAVRSVLESGKVNYWTGDETHQFEKEFSAFVDVNYAVAMMNGTVALEAILYAMGIEEGDEVIVTPRTYIASASCAVLHGARPVFADIDRDSQNITAAAIEKVITSKTKAVIAVHLAGRPCDMDDICNLVGKYNLRLVEDCAQAHGSEYKGLPVGSFGDAAAFSFCQDKIMTTGGEGGMVITNSRDLWEKIWSYKDHGKCYDAVYNQTHPPGFRWLHESFGTNLRMTEMQAAIGRIQLRKLPGWVEIRRRNASILTERFAKIGAFRVITPPPEVFHSYYKYYVFIRPERLRSGWDRNRIIENIVKRGVPCFSGSCSEVYLEKAFSAKGLNQNARLPVARELGETSLMFLVHPTLSAKDMEIMADEVGEVMWKAAV